MKEILEFPEEIKKDCEFVFSTMFSENKMAIASMKSIGATDEEIFRTICLSQTITTIAYLESIGKIKFSE